MLQGLCEFVFHRLAHLFKPHFIGLLDLAHALICLVPIFGKVLIDLSAQGGGLLMDFQSHLGQAICQGDL